MQQSKVNKQAATNCLRDVLLYSFADKRLQSKWISKLFSLNKFYVQLKDDLIESRLDRPI